MKLYYIIIISFNFVQYIFIIFLFCWLFFTIFNGNGVYGPLSQV